MGSWAAHQVIQVGTRLARLPGTAEALADGSIGFDHARAIATVATAPRAAAAARDEAGLIAAAQRMTPAGLRRHCDEWRHTVDADGGEAEAADAYEDRRFRVGDPDGGRSFVDGVLDVEGAAIVRTGLAAARDAGAKPDDDRTVDQRNADALVDVFRRFLTTGQAPVRGRRKPHLLVTLDLRALQGRGGGAALLGGVGGAMITAEAARRLACDAQVSRVITDGPSMVVDVGHATQAIPVGTRKALEARDRGCRGEHCSARIEVSEGHHRQHWAHGGPTDLANLASR